MPPTVSKLAIVAGDRQLQFELMKELKQAIEQEAVNSLRAGNTEQAAALPLAEAAIRRAMNHIVATYGKDNSTETKGNNFST